MSQNRFLGIVKDYHRLFIEECPLCETNENVIIYQELEDGYCKFKCNTCQMIWTEGDEI